MGGDIRMGYMQRYIPQLSRLRLRYRSLDAARGRGGGGGDGGGGGREVGRGHITCLLF